MSPTKGEDRLHASTLKKTVLLAASILISLADAGNPLSAANAQAGLPGAGADMPLESGSAVWTATGNQQMLTRVGVLVVPHLFTRLDVIGRGPAGVAVTCRVCTPMITGYLTEEDLISTADTPDAAASRDLPVFLASIREAARRRDLSALLSVMAPDFSYDFIGIQTPEAGFEGGRAEEFKTLEQVPALVDHGVTTDDQRIWVSPPAFLHDLTYHGPRLGFRRRPDGRWEWLFLVRGVR